MKKVLLTLMVGLFLISFTSALTNITNCSELQDMENNLAEDYQLMNDIDCSDTINWNSGRGFRAIGLMDGNFQFLSFTGTFNGNGYTISDLYQMNESAWQYCGLFGLEQYAEFSNFKLINPIINCSNSIEVGAVIGGSLSAGTIFHNISVEGGAVYGNARVGGLVGYREGKIIDSYSNANVTANGEAGGLVGRGFDLQINNSYASGDYFACVGSYCGGILGRDLNPATTDFNNNFYNNDTYVYNDTTEGTPLSTADMKALSTYSAWDIVDKSSWVDETWFIDDGNDYPRLFYEFVDESPIITINSPQSTTYDYPEISLDVEADKEISLWYYSTDGGVTNTTFTTPTSIIVDEGSTTLIVWGETLLGAVGNNNVTFTYETLIPNEIVMTDDSVGIYGISRGVGAGLGGFFGYLVIALPVFLIGLTLVVMVVVIGKEVAEVLRSGKTIK